MHPAHQLAGWRPVRVVRRHQGAGVALNAAPSTCGIPSRSQMTATAIGAARSATRSAWPWGRMASISWSVAAWMAWAGVARLDGHARVGQQGFDVVVAADHPYLAAAGFDRPVHTAVLAQPRVRGVGASGQVRDHLDRFAEGQGRVHVVPPVGVGLGLAASSRASGCRVKWWVTFSSQASSESRSAGVLPGCSRCGDLPAACSAA